MKIVPADLRVEAAFGVLNKEMCVCEDVKWLKTIAAKIIEAIDQVDALNTLPAVTKKDGLKMRTGKPTPNG